ncbi:MULTISPECIES: hypothetical protein [Peribacillus]|uniref:hypothetical protein n=1 Tax=Peribacillus TaxID=2675229 RepID=UPI00351F7E8E
MRVHPCQKPVIVLEKIIATHTNKGETKMDCFMGGDQQNSCYKSKSELYWFRIR